MAEIILVTGPSRSGKSEWAERWAKQTHKPVIYIATSTILADDIEWQKRVELHRQRRPEAWETKEIPKELASTIRNTRDNQCLLVESLGTWLANWMTDDDEAWQACVDELLATLADSECDVILVAEETGWGLVPAYPGGRLFRDRLGSLVRQIGHIATQVYLVTGGYALDLKQLGTPLPIDS
ncbi:MAG: bifunctional adenosylcobinamide kinase/adenosylcobinamide-phosphate guanylyltransferase [Cyanobacteria bacterium P01_D01_bin.56]